MIECVREYLDEWKTLKRVMFFNIGEGKWYRDCFEGLKGEGVRPVDESLWGPTTKVWTNGMEKKKLESETGGNANS